MVIRYLAIGFCLLLAMELPANEPKVGSFSGLHIPRFVSIKAEKANARRGPSLSHRIDWVYQHKGTPVRVIAEYENWRRVADKDGAGGWIHRSLLSGVRTAVVIGQDAVLRSRPSEEARERARVEINVTATLLECQLDWCRLNVRGHKGWLPKSVLWGVAPDEILN